MSLVRVPKIEDIIEENETFSDDALFNITSFGTDLTFRELIMMYDEGELEKPELQRKYVWNRNEASRFIDSILLGLPVPSIFLAKTKDEKRLIVDGYQRIMTIYDFVNKGVFGGDGKSFYLSNSDIINEKWRGKTYQELSEDEKRKIRNSQIHAIVFEQKHPQDDSGMYQIFERINTSGRALKPQEIRNCIYHGNFNKLLIELNNNKIWRSILNAPDQDTRMADIELILRFFAFSLFRNQVETFNKQINLVKYLNYFMARKSNLTEEEAAYYSKIFKDTTSFLFQRIGCDLFKNGKVSMDGYFSFSPKINPAILDSVSAAAVNFYLVNNLSFDCFDKTIDLLEKYKMLLKDTNYQDAVTHRTTNVEKIKTRINIASDILFGINYGW